LEGLSLALSLTLYALQGLDARRALSVSASQPSPIFPGSLSLVSQEDGQCSTRVQRHSVSASTCLAFGYVSSRARRPALLRSRQRFDLVIYRPQASHYEGFRTSQVNCAQLRPLTNVQPDGSAGCLGRESEVVVVVGSYANLNGVSRVSVPTRHAASTYRDPVETVSPPHLHSKQRDL